MLEIYELIEFYDNKILCYKVTYYDSDLTMDGVLELIPSMDIFILFLSKNSAENENVMKEIYAAKMSTQIGDYLTVILDLQVEQSSIPEFKNNNIISENSSIKIAEDISKIINKSLVIHQIPLYRSDEI